MADVTKQFIHERMAIERDETLDYRAKSKRMDTLLLWYRREIKRQWALDLANRAILKAQGKDSSSLFIYPD